MPRKSGGAWPTTVAVTGEAVTFGEVRPALPLSDVCGALHDGTDVVLSYVPRSSAAEGTSRVFQPVRAGPFESPNAAAAAAKTQAAAKATKAEGEQKEDEEHNVMVS